MITVKWQHMSSENVVQLAELEEYGIEKDDIDIILDELPEYASVRNKGRLAESKDAPFSSDGMLDEDEKPNQVGREGESSISIGYSDFEVLLAGMAGERDFNVSEDRRLDLSGENKEEALGALFGASYAVFRRDVMEEGFPADHDSFEQDIGTQDEKERFMQEGAYEIQGEVMGSWGYNYEIMNEIMDAEQALETYNEVVDQIV